MYLTAFKQKRQRAQRREYPFSCAPVAALEQLLFGQPLTILCGDNGSGKTTILELLGAKAGCSRIGSQGAPRFSRQALDTFSITMARRPAHSFLFSSEDFLTYLRWREEVRRDSAEQMDLIREEYKDRSVFALQQALSPYSNTLGEMDSMYGRDLARSSHGEGYLSFFGARFVPGGLYLLDEPEAALTYENQYVLGMMIRDALKEGSQFVLATHSPVLCALKEACLYQIQGDRIVHTQYESLQDVAFLRAFLQEPQRYYR